MTNGPNVTERRVADLDVRADIPKMVTLVSATILVGVQGLLIALAAAWSLTGSFGLGTPYFVVATVLFLAAVVYVVVQFARVAYAADPPRINPGG